MHDRCGWHCGSLLVLTVLLAAGIWTFKSGFLLSRVELDDQSRCFNNGTGEKFCFPGLRPTFRRAIVIVVDALKYEFLITKPNLEAHTTKTYENKIPQVGQLVKLHPENAALFKFIADPPTTTMQRLKGLTTGSLPTFIDITKNFAATTISEDNIIDQARRMGKNVTFMGDDTWTKLFPDSFMTSFPYPSFDVRDLDTVDRGVTEHLIPEMKKNNWTLLIAHLLGVDHCGHRYGRDHPEMARKLGEVNSLIRTVVRTLADDTVLFVMGDHGMTKTGDHGGDSQDEVEAGLFVYGQLPWIDTKLLTQSVAQVDFVPTLSLLLGHPIPFSNLGRIIPAFFNQKKNSDPLLPQVSLLSTALRINADQIFNFLQRYSTVSSDLTGDVLENLSNLYRKTIREEKFSKNSTFSEILENSTFLEFSKNSSFLEISDFSEFFEKTFSSCQKIWAKFDENLMFFGLMLVGVSVCGVLIILLLPTGLRFRSDALTVFAVAANFVHFFSLFSNSFQIFEDFSVFFFFQTFLFLHFLFSFPTTRMGVFRFWLLALLIRGLGVVKRCREEHTNCFVSKFSVNFENLEKNSLIFFFRWTMGVATPLAIASWFQLRFLRFSRPNNASFFITAPLFAASVLVLVVKFLEKIGNFPEFDLIACRTVYLAAIFIYGHLFLFPVFIRRSKTKMPVLSAGASVTGRKLSSHCLNGVDRENLSSEFNEICESLEIFGKIFALPLMLVLTLLLADSWSFFSLATLVLAWFQFGDVTSSIVKISVWAFLSWQIFFVSGHQTNFQSIHWLSSAFVGIGPDAEKSQWLQFILVILETFSGQIFAAVAFPSFFLLDGKKKFSLQNPRFFWIRMWRNTLAYILWHASKLFFVMLNAAINRRHLMVWKIFAPRFIFEAFSFAITTFFILFGYFFSARAFSATLNSVSHFQVPLDQFAERTKEFPDKSSRKRR